MNDAMLRIAKRLTGLVAKRPGLVVGIWGEPGIGKTHTVKQLLRETPCRNLSFHATTSPTELARVLPKPTKLPVWAERTFDRALKGEHVEITTLTDALGATLSGLAPFVLHLEDVHEASAGQLEFVQALAKIVPRLKGVGLIITSREQPPEGFESVRLEPLSSQSVQEMLKAEVSAELPNEALEWIQTRAAGNPLFSLEFFRFLSRQGFLWSDGQKWRWRTPNLEMMPISVEGLIEQLTAKAMLAPTLEIVVQAKALLGREVQLELWAKVADVTLEILEDAKTELEHEGILLGDEFAHPLYADVIARNLSAEKRQLLARRAIEALEHDPMAAAEFVEDANLEPERALGLFEMAAEICKKSGRNYQAAQFQAKTIKYLQGDALAERAIVAAKGLARHDLIKATQMVTVALELHPDDPYTIYQYANVMAHQGKVEEVNNVFNRLSTIEIESVRGLSERISCFQILRDYANVVALWQKYLKQTELPSAEVIADVAIALANLGDTVSATKLVSEALMRSDLTAFTRLQLIEIVGIIAFNESDYRQAEQRFAQAGQFATDNNLNPGASLFNRALALQKMGQHKQAISDIEAFARIANETGNTGGYFESRSLLAEGLLECSEYERAEEIMLEVQTFFETRSISERHIENVGGLCDLYRDWNAPHSSILALRYGRNAVSLARTCQNPRFLVEGLFYGAISEAFFGNPNLALELADEAFDLASTRHEPRHMYKSGWARGCALAALGHTQEAIAVLQQAYRIALEVGARLHENRIGLEIARVSQDLEVARNHFTWFQEHELFNGANIAVRYFPELAADTPRATPIMIQTRLEVFGSIQFVTTNSSIPVRGQKRRELLALLLEARISGRKDVSRLELLDVLYPNTDELQAGTLLKDVVYQVREIGGSSAILTTENGYALGEVTSDAETFLETGNTQLWRGAYLDGLNLERNNETVRETLHLALQTHAENLLETDPAETARVGRLLIAADSYNLGALRLTLNALRVLQNHKTLSRLYTKSRDQLLEIGEVLPIRWQDFLENQIGIIA